VEKEKASILPKKFIDKEFEIIIDGIKFLYWIPSILNPEIFIHGGDYYIACIVFDEDKDFIIFKLMDEKNQKIIINKIEDVELCVLEDEFMTYTYKIQHYGDRKIGDIHKLNGSIKKGLAIDIERLVLPKPNAGFAKVKWE